MDEGSPDRELPAEELTPAVRRHAELITDRRAILSASATGLASLAGCTGILNRSDTGSPSPPDELLFREHFDGLSRPPPDARTDRAPRNVILIIPDGAGQAQISAARYLKAFLTDPEAFPKNMGTSAAGLAVDRAPVVGEMATYPDDEAHLITDSAAAGTAMATGVKTYNGGIGGVGSGDEFAPRTSVLERAYQAGMATGLVTTTRITHATPAAFATHSPDRSFEDMFARQYLYGGHVDVLLGGGARHFRAEARRDGRALLQRAAENGYAVIRSAEELRRVSTSRVLGLFADSHLDYYVNRRAEEATQPLLPEMARTAVELLERSAHGRQHGYFLLIEAGRVDHLGHANHPAIAHEQFECDAVFSEALARAGERTLVVQVADHETGGLSLGRDEYDMDWAAIVEAARMDDNRTTDLGWTTGGHTGAAVPVYAAGVGAERFRGYFDNTVLSDRIAKTLDLPA